MPLFPVDQVYVLQGAQKLYEMVAQKNFLGIDTVLKKHKKESGSELAQYKQARKIAECKNDVHATKFLTKRIVELDIKRKQGYYALTTAFAIVAACIGSYQFGMWRERHRMSFSYEYI